MADMQPCSSASATLLDLWHQKYDAWLQLQGSWCVAGFQADCSGLIGTQIKQFVVEKMA